MSEYNGPKWGSGRRMRPRFVANQGGPACVDAVYVNACRRRLAPRNHCRPAQAASPVKCVTRPAARWNQRPKSCTQSTQDHAAGQKGRFIQKSPASKPSFPEAAGNTLAYRDCGRTARRVAPAGSGNDLFPGAKMHGGTSSLVRQGMVTEILISFVVTGG
jgi:hypothetical protein